MATESISDEETTVLERLSSPRARGWMIAYRTRPPNTEIVLNHVRFGRPPKPGSSDDPATPRGTNVDDD